MNASATGKGDIAAFMTVYTIMASFIAWPFLAGPLGMAFADIGIDTISQFYPLNVEHSRQLAAGDGLGWSFRLGLGGYTGTHFDPFMYLQAWFPQDWQLGLRIFTYLLKLGLAGLLMVAYLRLIGAGGWPALLGGLAYAFSDYALINGQWDLHGTELLHFVAIAWLLESWLRGGKPWLAIGAGLLLGAGHPFNLFTSAFFAAIYVLARTFVLGQHRQVWPLTFRLSGFGLGVVVGLLIMAPILLTSLHYFFDSPRVSGGHMNLAHVLAMALTVNDPGTIAASMFGFLGKNAMGVADAYSGWANWLEGPGFYVGLPALLLSVQLASGNARPAHRRLFWLAVVGIALYVLIPGFRYAVYGFNHVVFRTSTLWISMLLVVTAALGLRQVIQLDLDRRLLAVALAAIAAFLIFAMLVVKVPLNTSYLVIAMALLALQATVLSAWGRAPSRLLLTGLVALFCLELVLLVRPSLTARAAVERTGSVLVAGYDDGTHEALQWIAGRHDDTDFYRVEKDYISVFLADSLIQNYHGIRSYFFHGASLTRFIDHLGWPRLTPHSNYIDADTGRSSILDLLGVRYLLAKTRERDTDPGVHHIASVAGIEIYERPSAHSIARLHGRVMNESDVVGMAVAERDEIFQNAVLSEDVAAIHESLSVERNESGGAVDVTMQRLSDHHLRGRYDTAQVQLLALAMPFDRGWRLILDDGSELPLVRVNYGLAGAVVPAGSHGFDVRYQPPGRSLGYWLSPIGIVIAVLMLFWPRIRRRFVR